MTLFRVGGRSVDIGAGLELRLRGSLATYPLAAVEETTLLF